MSFVLVSSALQYIGRRVSNNRYCICVHVVVVGVYRKSSYIYIVYTWRQCVSVVWYMMVESFIVRSWVVYHVHFVRRIEYKCLVFVT